MVIRRTLEEGRGTCFNGALLVQFLLASSPRYSMLQIVRYGAVYLGTR
jgi:hypothetical protein